MFNTENFDYSVHKASDVIINVKNPSTSEQCEYVDKIRNEIEANIFKKYTLTIQDNSFSLGVVKRYASPKIKGEEIIICFSINNKPYRIQLDSEDINERYDDVIKAIKTISDTLASSIVISILDDKEKGGNLMQKGIMR